MVNVPNLVPSLNRPPRFELYVVRCGSKNECQKGTCLKEIGPHAQNMITILKLNEHILEIVYDIHTYSINYMRKVAMPSI